MPFTTETARWRALSIRDPTANGHFFYTVKTTNCYCRPTCPARLARRANIGFCKTAAEAEAAGYRACKRCKPNEERPEDPQEQAVAKACRLIEQAVQRGDEKAGRLQDLAKSVGLTPRYFHKVFKDRMRLTPKEYAKSKVEGAGGGGTDPFLHGGLDDLGPMNLEGFDFNDLVDFGAGASLSTDHNTPSAPAEQGTPGFFGNENDVNVLMPATVENWPNAINTSFSVSDKLFQQFDASSLSDKAMMVTTTAFDMDAALLLNSDTLPEFNAGMYGDLFA
ncbi:hypothetical protein K458DRAFT_405505 [Lentithecium fluviatile CBS 122367]|uniref:HTH araC/xylS-type domain-containing protein n=1 Tax=Lentithecium fluviatile CBS 122367 TaxID=1168545 RepID=A0A6G1IXZ0_9PLEO|nr:hypothetical protein K458DRAFT_405505 [Lentithecium fluviatile CBS 122367]